MPMAGMFRLLEECLRPEMLDAMEGSDETRMIVATARCVGAESLNVVIEDVHTLMGVEYSPEAHKFIDEMPSSLKETIRATIVWLYDHRDTHEIRLHYTPAYNFGVKVFEWGEGEGRKILDLDVQGPVPAYL